MKKITNIDKVKHIHFMGIGGSGCSAAAYLAKKAGFRVTGCDFAAARSPYLSPALHQCCNR